MLISFFYLCKGRKIEKKLKKIIYIIISLSIFFVTCKENTDKQEVGKENHENDFFSRKSLSANGDYVLAPSKKTVDSLLANGTDNLLFVFYPRKVLKNEGEKVIVDEYGDSVVIPASLVIDLQKNKKVAKADIVLTWWQKATGMQRAIVLNRDSTSTPVVYYLDNMTTPPKNQQQFILNIDTLIPNSFRVVNFDSICPGRAFATDDDKRQFYIVINSVGDSVLGLSWAGTLKSFDKKNCVFATPPETLDTGEMVFVPYVGNYHPAEILQIWGDIGKIKVNVFLLDTFFTTYANIPDIIPNMQQ